MRRGKLYCFGLFIYLFDWFSPFMIWKTYEPSIGKERGNAINPFRTLPLTGGACVDFLLTFLERIDIEESYKLDRENGRDPYE
jgi:hypothetical protein